MDKNKVLMLSGVCVLSLLIGWFAHGMLGEKKAGGAPVGRPAMPPASVVVQTVQLLNLQPVAEYIAKVDPIEDVMIRSEVSGTIDAVHFTEGAMVKEGDLLFAIDPQTYQATADAAAAEMNRTQKLYERMKKADTRSVSQSDLETAESNFLRAQADFKVAEVALGYTKIKAPVSGRIGVAQVTKGNYVTPASGALARIVQIDPIRITFSLTDRDYLQLRQRELAGTEEVQVAQVRLPEGTILPTLGKKDFDDNVINSQTGTIAVRYLFDNADGLLIPGGYVTALVRNFAEKPGIRIPHKAMLIDQQGPYVLTVDEAGVVAVARIVAGLPLGADVIVDSGLKPGDRIVVDGLQKARPGATVQVIGQ